MRAHKILTIVFFILFVGCASAQITRQAPLLELVRIGEVYRTTPSLSFSMQYTYVNMAQPDSILEQVSGQAKASSGKFWSMIDSVESVQGSQYNITAYKGDTLMVINDRSSYGDLMRLPFLDSAFRAANVNSTSISEVNDTTYSFVATFQGGSTYNSYALEYDNRTFRVKKVVYQLLDNTSTTPFTGRLTVVFSGYSTAPVDETIFQEARFAYKVNGQFVPASGFQGYTIINNTSN